MWTSRADTTQRVVIHGKCKVAKKSDPLSFRVESRAISGWDGDLIDTAGIAWLLGAADGLTARDVLGGVLAEREAPKLSAAEGLLLELLSDAPAMVREIKDAAAGQGRLLADDEHCQGRF